MADQRKASSLSRSRRRTVTDEHQTEQLEELDEDTTVTELLAIKNAKEGVTSSDEYLSPEFTPKKPSQDRSTPGPSQLPNPILLEPPASTEPIIEISRTNRPKANGIAFPFSLGRSNTNHSLTASVASTATLTSTLGVPPLNSGPPLRDREVEFEDGDLAKVTGKENMKPSDEGKGKGEENMEEIEQEESKGEDRPGLESFVTASEGLPTLSGGN
jgi:hypothetical protein